jgi:regulator of cell morphogenesis and NO signaling
MKTADLILRNPNFIIMLEHFGLDYVVQEKTIEEICNENNINTEVFLSFASLFNGASHKPKKSYGPDDISVIISFLQKSHKYYLDEKCPALHRMIGRMQEVNDYKEIKLVEKFFREYLAELNEHFSYEDDIVFPYICDLYRHLQNKSSQPVPCEYSVKTYKAHHHDIEEKLKDLKSLLIKYLPLKEDRQIRRELIFSLFEFEHDLHIHSQIEDFILIPLVESLEKSLGKAGK